MSSIKSSSIKESPAVNADEIQGTSVSRTPPTDNQILVYDLALNKLVYESVPGSVPTIIQDSEEGVDSTNSGTPQLAFTTTKTLETAKYVIIMSMELEGAGGGGNQAEGTFEYDAGSGNVEIGKAEQGIPEYCVRTTIYFLNATAGNYDFEFWFNKNGGGGASVNVRRKRLVITKVVE